MTQTELGQIVGAGKQSISDWERGITGPTRKHFFLLSRALKIDLDTLLSLSGTATTSKKKPLSGKSNVINPPRMTVDVPNKEGAGGMLPLLSWEQVASWGGQLDTTTAVKEWLPCDVAHGKLAFWLEVAGISMYAPDADVSFREGDQIAVDPEHEATHLNFVLVSVDDNLYLRQLIIDGATRFLKAIAPGWPNALTALRAEDSIIGTVIKWQPKGKTLV